MSDVPEALAKRGITGARSNAGPDQEVRIPARSVVMFFREELAERLGAKSPRPERRRYLCPPKGGCR